MSEDGFFVVFEAFAVGSRLMGSFKEVPTKIDFVKQENELQAWWDQEGIRHKYLHRNDASAEKFSFLDGPITANNPMGVHHAWGRTYKDVFQRYHTMLGKQQRYQNGFDCQGLWVEVEVEKELGLKSKRDIEAYGIAEFVERCKAARLRSSPPARATSRSALGYWMDWDNSYYTMSDENNYTIWHFLKTCHERGWIYKGHDVMPWCPRCGTGLSEHEIVTEGYQERTHLSVSTCASRCSNETERHRCSSGPRRPGRWPPTSRRRSIPISTYVQVEQDGQVLLPGEGGAPRPPCAATYESLDELPGRELLGWAYRGPFDELPARARRAAPRHRLERRQRRRRHRHRPYRARLRQRRLRALQGERPRRSSRRSTSSASMSTASTG